MTSAPHGTVSDMSQALLTGTGVILGAVLALVGGLYLEHRRYLRRRRVAGRLLFDDLFGHLTQVEVDRQDALERTPPPRERDLGDEIDVDLTLWNEHRATVAETRDPELFETVSGAYSEMRRYAEADPACVAEFDRQEIIAHARARGRRSALEDMDLHSRDDMRDEVEGALRAAITLTGRWAGFSEARVSEITTPLAEILRDHEDESRGTADSE